MWTLYYCTFCKKESHLSEYHKEYGMKDIIMLRRIDKEEELGNILYFAHAAGRIKTHPLKSILALTQVRTKLRGVVFIIQMKLRHNKFMQRVPDPCSSRNWIRQAEGGHTLRQPIVHQSYPCFGYAGTEGKIVKKLRAGRL